MYILKNYLLSARQRYANSRLMTVFILGIASGLPFALTSGTLQSWYTTAGSDIMAVSLLAFTWLPLNLKFLWAPVMDKWVLPGLGRRRGWIFLSQGLVTILLILMAFGNPKTHPIGLGLLAFLAVFASATQDIAIDAYRADVLKPAELGWGAALGVGGYRLAIFISGGLALIMADVWGWKITYFIMAFCMLGTMVASWWGPEPNYQVKLPKNFYSAVIEPWHQFFTRPQVWLIILFILFYKLAQAFVSSTGSLLQPFLLGYLNFSLTTVGLVNKSVGLIMTIVGVFLGGAILMNLGLYRALKIFAIGQAATILLFALLAIKGKSIFLLIVAICSDNLAVGMATAAMVAFLMNLCDARYTATQMALLTAMAALPRTFLSPLAGLLIEHSSWTVFFILNFLLALPSIYLLNFLSPALFKDNLNEAPLKNQQSSNRVITGT